MILVTFSGLDGCGKSTHVERTCAYLAARGLRTYRFVTLRASLTGVVTLFRERVLRRPTHAAARAAAARSTGGSARAESPRSAPLVRTYAQGRTFDADRRRVRVRLQRWFAYPFDCVAILLVLTYLRLGRYDAVVCDRYIPDKAVNIPNPAGPLYRLMGRLVPRADLAIFLDAPPQVAMRRRCEHEADYYATKYWAYRELVRIGALRAYPSESIEATQQAIEDDLRPLCTAAALPAARLPIQPSTLSE